MAAAFVAAAGAPLALAQARPTRPVQINVKPSERTRPKPRDPATPAAPSLEAGAVLSLQGVVRPYRAEQIQLLRELIASTPDHQAQDKAELHLRLADLYAFDARYWRLKGTEWAIAADKARSVDKSKLARDAGTAAAKSKQSLLEAVKVYRELAGNPRYRGFARMDQALFYCAYMLQSGDYPSEARQVFQQLIKEHPGSRYIPEAYLVFADYYFQQGSLGNAEQFYDKVLQYPKSSVYTYALYMRGWVFLNLRRHQEALATFLEVARQTHGDPRRDVLNRAAKKDFVRAYAEVGKEQKAFKAFARVDKGYAFTMLESLADIYLEQGKSEKAIYVFRELISSAPANKNVCLWQYNVAHAMLTAGGNAQKVDEIEKLANLYRAVRDGTILPAAEAEECHDNAAAMVGEMARAWHSEWMRTQDPELLSNADKLYRVYLDVFAGAEDFGETEYYYAELSWARAEGEKQARRQTELWEQTAQRFTQVVERNKVDAKLLEVSAHAAALAAQRRMQSDPRPEVDAPPNEPAGQIPQALPIPAREQQMLAAFDLYLANAKGASAADRPGIMFLKARTYWRYHRFDKALPVFEEIIAKHPEHETAEYAANLLLDSLNRLQRHEEMLRWVERLAADKKFLEGRESLEARLEAIEVNRRRIVGETCTRVARERRDPQEHVRCARLYVESFNHRPDAEGNDAVLWNAAINFEEGKSIGMAIQMFQLLRERFPDSPWSKRALAKLGQNYGRIAWYKESSEKFEEFAKAYGAEQDAYEAYDTAISYRKGIGDDAKAIENTRQFVARYRDKREEAADAFFSLTSIYEKQGNPEKVVDHLREYLVKHGATGGIDRVVIANAKIGQLLWGQACPVTAVDGECVKATRQRAVARIRSQARKRGGALPSQCGPETKTRLTVVPRDPRKVREAQLYLRRAADAFEKRAGKPSGDEAIALHHYALAKLVLADAAFETFLAIGFPADLDFSPHRQAARRRSLERFDGWLASKAGAAAAAREQYEKIIFQYKDAANAVAAAARIGQIQQHFSDQLFTAEIPKSLRTGPYAEDAVDAYCDALTEKTDPLEVKALEAFRACLERSTEMGWSSEWSRLCERELGQLRPEQFPTAVELRRQPDAMARISSVEGSILALESR